MNDFRMPLDYETSDAFQRLLARAGSLDRARSIYVTLFVRLGYAAREGGKPGWIASTDRALYESRIGDKLDDLVNDRMLMTKTEGYFCPMFHTLNLHAALPRELKGARARQYDKRVNDGAATVTGDALLIPKDRLVDAEGNPLTPEQIRRIRLLVLCCDSALGKTHERAWDYSPQLIQNALRLLARYTDEQINAVCRAMWMDRDHPALAGHATETLIAPVSGGERAIFDEVLEKLGLNEPA